MELGDSLTTILVIFLAAGLMFIFPMSAISEMNDKEALAMVQSYTTEFGNQVRTQGRLTNEMLDSFKQKLNATGNSYDIEIELHIADANPGKKTENQQIGDTTYYVLYTTQVMQELNEKGSITLKEGDYIVIYVKNTNKTISQMFKTVLYGITGDQSYLIYTQYSGAILATGQQ